MQNYLDFEKGLAELQGKAEELRVLAREDPNLDVSPEADQLQARGTEMLRKIYADLSAWQKCQVARHPERPHALTYIDALFSDYTPLSGDRNYGEDHAIVGGLARFQERPVVVIGHEKGNDTKSRLQRNFGMARPEGYRKAVRLMSLAGRFKLPVITLVDTPGAYPGKGAEQRGQAEAIARSTAACLRLPVPMITVITGEGGSGGAVAMATANHVIMLEHSVYSVISPEGCASILWKNAEKMEEAANALRLTAQDLEKLGVADHVVTEPVGGAQRDTAKTIESVGNAIAQGLRRFDGMDALELCFQRREKYLKIGSTGLA